MSPELVSEFSYIQDADHTSFSSKSNFLKTFKFLLAVTLIGGVVIACGKNKPATNPATSPLYGSWKSLGAFVTGCTDTLGNSSRPDCCGTGELCCGTIEFTQTTMTSSGVTGTRSSTYTINGNTFNYPTDGGVPTIFTIVDTILTLTFQHRPIDGNCLIVSTYTKI